MSKSVLDWMLEQKKILPHGDVTKRDPREDILIHLLRNLDAVDNKLGQTA